MGHWEEADEDLASVRSSLEAEGVVERVTPGTPEERLWLDCDLASLAENRLGDTTDPRALDDARRADWLARATSERPWPLDRRGEFESCYFLREAGERVGTIALSRSTLGSRSARVSSFYVMPTRRSTGVGRRSLDALGRALAAARLGYRLETSWTWPRAVRFYLAFGLWVRMWKHDLQFTWHAKDPRHRIRVDDTEAELAAVLDGAVIPLVQARRRGDALELDEPPADTLRDERLGEAAWHAVPTLSVALALRGWPLIRSRAIYDAVSWADGGPPEALARRVEAWEAWDTHRGWRVETPRIPGIAYRSWEELQAPDD